MCVYIYVYICKKKYAHVCIYIYIIIYIYILLYIINSNTYNMYISIYMLMAFLSLKGILQIEWYL